MENNREERIRQRASGCPHGRDLEHWSEASRQIEDEDASAGARLSEQIRTQRPPPAEAA